MARPKLEPSWRGEIDATAQQLVDGKWKQLPVGMPVRSAGRWRARAFYCDFAGVRRDVSAHAPTKRAAITNAQRKVDEALSGGSGELTQATTLVNAAEGWIVQIERTDSELADTTISLYKNTVRRHITSPGSPIRGLTLGQANSPARVRAFLQSVADQHGTATAKTVKSVLSNLLNFAVEDGALPTNAVRQVRPVKSQVQKLPKHDTERAFTRGERAALLAFADQQAAAETFDPRTQRKREAVADLAWCMAGLGVRIGEARGLRWGYLDLDAGFVRLHGTKSPAARRRLDLPPWLTTRLVERKSRMARHYLAGRLNAKKTPNESRAEVIDRLTAYASTVGVSGYVVSSPARLDPERLWDQANASNAMRTLLDDAGFPWAPPHAFRRTASVGLEKKGFH